MELPELQVSDLVDLVVVVYLIVNMLLVTSVFMYY